MDSQIKICLAWLLVVLIVLGCAWFLMTQPLGGDRSDQQLMQNSDS